MPTNTDCISGNPYIEGFHENSRDKEKTMLTDFKVYKRKIHVFRALTHPVFGRTHIYAWSTNACKTCPDAIARAKELHPDAEFKANFAKL